MTEASPYRDQRQEFFRSWFERGLDYESYLAASPVNHQARWQVYETALSGFREKLEPVRKFVRRMPVLVLSGSWCGDCARQGPMLRAIELASSVMSFRYLDNKENPELQDELRINGAAKVPVIAVFSEDFFELSRFGDRHLSVYRRKAAELGPACDSGVLAPEAEELQEELGEWVRFFERLQLMLRLSPALRKRYND
jgi:hypothetical protein